VKSDSQLKWAHGISSDKGLETTADARADNDETVALVQIDPVNDSLSSMLTDCAGGYVIQQDTRMIQTYLNITGA
jgi:hypothetical protein